MYDVRAICALSTLLCEEFFWWGEGEMKHTHTHQEGILINGGILKEIGRKIVIALFRVLPTLFRLRYWIFMNYLIIMQVIVVCQGKT